jgi:hypothetical protein
MITSEDVDKYLRTTMERICGSNASPGDETLPGERLFQPTTSFRDFRNALGVPRCTARSKRLQISPLHTDSLEHHFGLASWPDFEFIVFEAPDGSAWGQHFARAFESIARPIRSVRDLDRWSHTLTEIRSFLGPPIREESWTPWTTVTYRLNGGEFALCFVFELLQAVTPVTPPLR